MSQPSCKDINVQPSRPYSPYTLKPLAFPIPVQDKEQTNDWYSYRQDGQVVVREEATRHPPPFLY